MMERAAPRLPPRGSLCAVKSVRDVGGGGAQLGRNCSQAAGTNRLPYRNRTAIKPRSVMLAQGPWAEVQTAIKPQSAGL